MSAATEFKADATYWGRFITDADSKVEVKIERRTAKSVWVKDLFTKEITRRQIITRDDCEGFQMIRGVFISADRVA